MLKLAVPLFLAVVTAQCPEGMACQMEQSQFCRRGQCLMPYCVRMGSIMASAVDNPGACPISTVDTSRGCAGDEPNACMNDTSCAINQKCCIVGCSLDCVNVTSLALAQRRATATSRFPARMARRMSMVKQKMSMMKSRPKSTGYFCPTIPGDAFSSTCSNMGCGSDSDCVGNKRCCLAGCGKRCTNPVGVVGVHDGMKERSFRQRLESKANRTVDSQRRTPAEEMVSKTGVCPTVAVDAVINAESCVEDTDCNGTMKCCAHGLGFACMEPFQRRLPSPLMSSRLQIQRDGGDEQSLLRIRGMCPDSVQGFSCGSPCTGDNNCTSGELCCTIGSCNECVSPVISSTFINARPGLCPKFSPDLVAICVVSCNMDADCESANAKCCSVGCSRQCTNPVSSIEPMIKAGSCPAPASSQNETTTAMPMRGRRVFSVRGRFRLVRFGSFNSCRFDSCRSDDDCRGTRKCCRNSCNRMACSDIAA